MNKIESQIRWTRSDIATLSRAISDFNKKINELEKEGKKLYLPNLVDYQEVKENIQSRRALKNKVNSFRRFLREGAEELYITEGGEKLTKWEYKELKNMQRSATQKLNKELKRI